MRERFVSGGPVMLQTDDRGFAKMRRTIFYALHLVVLYIVILVLALNVSRVRRLDRFLDGKFEILAPEYGHYPEKERMYASVTRYREAGDLEALRDVRNIAQQHPRALDHQMLIVALLFEAGDYQEAAAVAEQVLTVLYVATVMNRSEFVKTPTPIKRVAAMGYRSYERIGHPILGERLLVMSKYIAGETGRYQLPDSSHER